MKDIIEFFYNNDQLIYDNIYLFLIWTIICITTTIAIIKKYYDKKNKDLIDEYKSLKEENELLKSQYRDSDEEIRLLMGRRTGEGLSAKRVSNKFKKGK